MKISGPVGALINDMVPDRPKYAAMTGKQYANAIKARLEPVTEKRLLYQQFLARTQQTGESVAYMSSTNTTFSDVPRSKELGTSRIS